MYVMTRLITIILTVLIIGVWGCGGSKVAVNAGAVEVAQTSATAKTVQPPAAETLDEKLMRIVGDDMLALDVENAESVDDLAKILEKLVDLLDTMVVIVEEHSGVTLEEISVIIQMFAGVEEQVNDIINMLSELDEDEIEDHLLEELDTLGITLKMIGDRTKNLKERLMVLRDTVESGYKK
jgi:hypothetical protein